MLRSAPVPGDGTWYKSHEQRRQLVTPKEIEQDLAEAGWKLEDGFLGHLISGERENLSMLPH
jgi:hypothetical protein